MMEPVYRVDGANADPARGRIRYDWPKLTWNLGIAVGAIVFAPLTFSWGVFAAFLLLTYTSLLVGHSVGMHRMMIHRSFAAMPWLERALIYIGVLVGMAGPYGVMRIHDLRDWAQRQSHCHVFFSHKERYLKDLWWQLTCRFEFDKPPRFTVEPKYANDPFLRWLEKTWRWHQLALAAVFYAIGGWSLVVWGVLVRVAVSVIGHWTVTYICHNPGPGRWQVKGAGVQASNLSGFGLLTYGECWHGVFPGQSKYSNQHSDSSTAVADRQ
jgi:stearoyl-CoA desaturase (delta-9 desaturase)